VHRVEITLALLAVVGALFLGACRGGSERLAGTSWTLATLDGHSALPQTTAWLRFDRGGRFGGSTGCNSLGGRWKSSGSELVFQDVSTTLIGCPGPVGEQEAAFNAALGETASYGIENGTLTLRDSKGASRMTFEPLTNASPNR